MSVQSAAGADITASPVIAAAELVIASISTLTETGCVSTATSAMAGGKSTLSVPAANKNARCVNQSRQCLR